MPPDSVHLVTWNINRGLQLEGIIDFLTSIKADVIVLQETDVNARRTRRRNVAREIAQALRMNYVFGCEFEELTQGESTSPALHGQATLSRLPLSGSRILRFRNQSTFWHPRWYIPAWDPFQRRLGGRMALVTNVDLLETKLVIYNVHLESRSDDNLRGSQVAEIFTDVRQWSSDIPVVIAGDFNVDLSHQPAATLVSNALFANHFNHSRGRPTTAPSRMRSARAIDWVLSKGALTASEARLHDSVRTSDHYPLSVVFRLDDCQGSGNR